MPKSASTDKDKRAENLSKGGDCFLGFGAKFEGSVRTPGFVRIEGDFSGSIFSDSSVVFGTSSRVEAEVVAKSVIISGKMKGRIQAEHEVQVLPSAKVAADIVASSLIVEKGGLVSGDFTRPK